jgi:hypothetical protein
VKKSIEKYCESLSTSKANRLYKFDSKYDSDIDELNKEIKHMKSVNPEYFI